jgi:hypothetical protein
MPLGFAKSTFTYAAAATSTGARAFNGGTTDNSSSDVATYRVPMSNRFAQNNGISIIYWIRYKHAELNTNQFRTVVYRDSQDQGGGQAWCGAGTNPFGLGMNLYNGSTNIVMSCGKSGSTFGNNLTAFQGLGDGSWHCIMLRIDITDASKRHIYIDGEDHTAGQTAGSSVNSSTGSHPKLDDIRFVGLKSQPGNDTSGGAYTGNDTQDFPSADMGPVWFYDTDVDITSSSVRAKYYNASNTDGYVDGGTDGTDGGASQPELYLYHTASTLANGGSLSNTPAKVTSGSGDIAIVGPTAGPGSGGTR